MEQDLRYVYQIYKEGSISKAAETLYLTQPALSQALKRVEAATGAEIFDRTRHPLRLTQVGETTIRILEKIVALEEDLSREISDLKDLKTGSLRIGGTHYLNAYLLPKVLSDFSRAYPGITIELLEGGSGQLVEALDKRELDLTFTCDPEQIARFDHRSAFYDHILLAVPESCPLCSQLSHLALTPQDILQGRHLQEDCPVTGLAPFKELEFMLLGPGNNLRERSLRMLQEAGFEPKIKMTLSQMVTAYHLANSGFGATFLCDRLVQEEQSHLLYFKPDSPLSTRLFCLLFPEQTYTPFSVRAFADFCIRAIREADLAHGRDWGVPDEGL